MAMRIVWQRVIKASVTVNNHIVSSIGKGALLLVGVQKGDTEKDVTLMADKCVNIRAFSDDQNRLNRSILDTRGELLIVSQFTLCAECRKGRRPSFTNAAPLDEGRKYYELLCDMIEEKGVSVSRGIFQTDMEVMLINNGPVTLILESKSDKSR